MATILAYWQQHCPELILIFPIPPQLTELTSFVNRMNLSLAERLAAREDVDASSLESTLEALSSSKRTPLDEPAANRRKRRKSSTHCPNIPSSAVTARIDSATAKAINKRLAGNHRARGKHQQHQEDPHIFRPEAEGFMLLHPPLPDPEQRWDWQEEQTFREFVDMGKRLPNSSGTGRFKLTPEREQITILNLAKTFRGDRLNRLSAFLEKFLGLRVTYSAAAASLSLKASKRKASVVDRAQGVLFPLTVLDNGSIDVFSIFDVLVEYVAPDDYSVLALFDHPLAEVVGDEEDQEICDVLGRACGDRVAAVHVYSDVTDLELFATIAHELLHTMGFDHTTFWECLMNPSCYNGDWLFLSPHNLKKLKLFLCQESNPNFVLDRYKSLLDAWWHIFIARSPDEQKHYEWLQQKIELIEST